MKGINSKSKWAKSENYEVKQLSQMKIIYDE